MSGKRSWLGNEPYLTISKAAIVRTVCTVCVVGGIGAYCYHTQAEIRSLKSDVQYLKHPTEIVVWNDKGEIVACIDEVGLTLTDPKTQHANVLRANP